MNFYKVKFLRNGTVQGHEYIFRSDDSYKIGDRVDLPKGKHGEITAYPEEPEIEALLKVLTEEKIGAIVGRTAESD